METIIYQGQEIQAEMVNYFSCVLPIKPDLDHQGEEELFRSQEGQYYLRRSLQILDHDGENERQASGRTFVHRISLTAAILWATMRTNAQTFDLCQDAREALKAPASTNGTRHFADGSMAVTLHLKPEPARLLRKACERQGTRPLIEVYTAIAADVRALLGTDGEEDRAVEALFDANIPDDEDDESTVVSLLHEDGRLYARVPLEPDLEAMLEEKAREEGTDIGTALVNCLRGFLQQPQAAANDRTEPTTYGVSQSTLEAAALSVRLDDEAAAAVRRYLEVTAWNFTAADIVSGCVVQALEIAFENQKEAEEMSGLANPQEHDGAWGYVETSINNAACRRTGSEETELKNPDDERTTGTGRVIIELVASDLSGEELDARDREAYRREHAKPNPADVTLLAAADGEEGK